MVVEITIPDKEKSAMEDKLWVNEFVGGNDNAFNWIVIKHKKSIFNLCYRFLQNYDEANDCAQECFVKVWKYLKGYRGDAKFSTWLYRIAINTCKNRITSIQYKMNVQSVHLSESEIGFLENMAPDDIEKKRKGIHVHDCIGKLDSHHKEVVLLRDIQGNSYQEICEITKLNLGTIKSRLARARMSLKTCLGGLL